MSAKNIANEIARVHKNCDSGDRAVLQYLKFGVQMSYIIPFAVIYGSFMVTIKRKRKTRPIFDDSFFSLIFVDGFVSLFFLLIDISLLRATSYIKPYCEYIMQLIPDLTYYLTPYHTLYLHAQFSKMLSTLAMSLNRFTAISYPLRHKTMWMQHCSKVILIILLLPLLFVWPVAIAETSFVSFDGQSAVIYEHKFEYARTTFGRILIGGSTLLFTVISSIVTSSKLSKLGKHMKRVEFSMNIATVFISAGFVLMLLIQASYMVVDMDIFLKYPLVPTIIFAATQVCNDFYMLSGPVVLLILDKNIRNSIFCCPRPKIKDNIFRSISFTRN